jgi:hypothetical protein
MDTMKGPRRTGFLAMIFLYICLTHLRSALFAGTVYVIRWQRPRYHQFLWSQHREKGSQARESSTGPEVHWSPAIRGSGPLIPGASHSFRQLTHLSFCSYFSLSPYLSRHVGQPMLFMPLRVFSSDPLSHSSCGPNQCNLFHCSSFLCSHILISFSSCEPTSQCQLFNCSSFR